MQYNDIKRNGFIVSDPSFKVSSGHSAAKVPDKRDEYINNSSNILEGTKNAFNEYAKEADKVNKSFFKVLLSTAIVVISLMFFIRYFTIGTIIFSDGKHIATAASEKAYESALGITEKKLDNPEKTELSLNAFPFILLRSKTTPPSEISNRLLLTLPEFKTAYTLYSDGEAVYTASSEENAKKILLSYVKEFSMNGESEITSDVAIKKTVTKKDKIMDYESCVKALKEKNCVNVVSVVNSTLEEAVPYQTTTQTDETLYIGEKVTVTKGISGKKEISQETVYKNGLAESSEIQSEKIVIEPVSEVIKVGTKEKNILETGVIWPLSKKGVISSRFGKRWGRIHEGLDIAIGEGTAVLAGECGIVSYVSENAGGYGKYIKISHGNGMETAYAHLNKINVTKGQAVRAGEVIALSGNTGRSTGPHLHFEVLQNGKQIDPEPFMK